MASARELARAALRDDAAAAAAVVAASTRGALGDPLGCPPGSVSLDALALPVAPLHDLPEALIACRPPALRVLGGAGAGSGVGGGRHAAATPPRLSRELAMAVGQWGYDVHGVPEEKLPSLCFGAIVEHAEVGALGVDTGALWRFVQAVARRYRRCPYHSFRHATDVVLGCSSMVRMMQRAHEGMLAEPQAVVSVLVAAMFHDTDHPGVMNHFLVATRHPLAILYNNQSPLERHHCATGLALLERPELDFLAPLAPDTQAKMRGCMASCVLSTDIAQNMSFVREVNAVLDAGAAGEAATPLPADLAMKLIIKAADIGNSTRSMRIHQPWIEGLMSEFFAQGDAEMALGIPISLNCDRRSVNVAKCQVGFLKLFVVPIFATASRMMPELKTGALAIAEANLAAFTAQAELEV
uniref:PDEase domain-containing protein n=1 Tax=Haptolina ericina TaxID=156174 RepID=A0A7S3BNT7_9EUKA|mmetsp:Transcript_63673/g.142003  ORF Transcript_63673/g.142003 Transcript_63673/m.142003 type:complete len:411 (+) Transcript_63673:3-1235(+)